MEISIYIYLFILGIVLGSFYNVVGLRISNGMSIVKPGSHCFKCKHVLKWYELIPLVSYLFLRGKCKSCGVKISIRYFIIELMTGLLFMFSYMMIDLDWELLVALTFISLLVIITVSDLEYMIIEDVVLLFFLFIILLERLFILLPISFSTQFLYSTFNISIFYEPLIGGLIGFGLLYWLAFIGKKVYNKEVMGGGDIKLYGIIGVVLGLKLTILSLFIAAFLGSLIGYILIGLKIIDRDTPVPFVPFIAIGTLITYFYGPDLLEWYTGLFI